MYRIVITALAGLACAGALLVAGVLSSAGPRIASAAADPGPAGQTPSAEANEEIAAQPRQRPRVRPSLTMPYFSFAQSLRRRG